MDLVSIPLSLFLLDYKMNMYIKENNNNIVYVIKENLKMIYLLRTII